MLYTFLKSTSLPLFSIDFGVVKVKEISELVLWVRSTSLILL